MFLEVNYEFIFILLRKNFIFIDIEKDKTICDIQIPELRSNLTRPCSLSDSLIVDGHTKSYDHHTIHWHLMHGNYFYILNL